MCLIEKEAKTVEKHINALPSDSSSKESLNKKYGLVSCSQGLFEEIEKVCMELYCRTEALGVEKLEPIPASNFTVASVPDPVVSSDNDGGASDYITHLVQDEATVAEILSTHIPPPEYYQELGVLWSEWWPDSDPDLTEHMLLLQEAFDTATVFAMSFGIAKFALAQHEAMLVGEIV